MGYDFISDRFLNIIDLDFETRSKANIFAYGAYAYAAHPSTEILLIRYSIEGGKIHGWRKGEPFPKRLKRAIDKGFMLRAHNWIFEFSIIKFCGSKIGFEYVPYEKFLCTAALSCRFGYPASLEDAAVAMGLPVKKDKKGKQLIQKFSTPSARKAHDWNEPEEFPELFDDFDSYCIDDVRVQQSIVNFVPHLLEKNEIKVFELTQKMNMRGIPIDIFLCEQADELRLKALVNIQIETKIITKGKLDNIRGTKTLPDWLATQDFGLPDLTAETIKNAIADIDTPKNVKEILKLRQSASKTSVAKYKKAISTVVNGLLHGGLMYYGAIRTGRFAGRSLQPHNFARPTLAKWLNVETLANLIREKDYFSLEILTGDVMQALSSLLRSMIYAPEGKKFVVADYSQIEARFVFWFADQKDALQDFLDGKDIYKVLACDIYCKALKEITDHERFVGKQGVLGLGFMMGAPKLQMQCLAMAGVDLGETLAKKVVKTYRSKYSKIAKMWKEVNAAAINAVLNHGETFECCNGKIKYVMHETFLVCILPSGRKLYYPDAVIKYKEYYGKMVPELRYKIFDKPKGGWVETSTFGGKLVENFVQATARDFMVNGMFEAEKHQYPVVLTVHDEIIALVDEYFGSVKELEKIICKIPKWAKGFPAVAEGWTGSRYKK